MSYFNEVSIGFADSASTDAFSRLRVSQPEGLFDTQFTYNLSPLTFEAVTNGSGATVTHDATNRNALMTFSSTPTGGKAFMQSYEYIPYQPGKSQSAFVTFNMNSGVSNVVKFAGLSDGVNGIEFQMNGTTPQFVIYSGTGNGNQIVSQSAWNVDKLNGTGVSGINIDFSKVQILVIDLQALYVGRVRVGFDINGLVYHAHHFEHANVITTPYFQTANLPVRCGMTCTGTVSTTMNFICSSVVSEGGSPESRGRGFSVEGTATAGNATRVHILSIRPQTTFNSISNRAKFELDSINMLVTGTVPVLWELCIGQAISGTTAFTSVNSTYSGFEFNTAGTISGSPTIVVANGYCGRDTGASAIFKNVTTKYPITLDASGAIRSLGTLSVLVTGTTATSACRCSLNWREIR
jgi:hypothetical protein